MPDNAQMQNPKRKRVDSGGLSGPDGFTTTKSSSKLSKTTMPFFSSAFDQKAKKPDTRKPAGISADPVYPKPAPRPDFSLDAQFLSTRLLDETASDGSTPKKPASRSSARVPPNPGKKLAITTLNVGTTLPAPILPPVHQGSQVHQTVPENASSRLKIPIPIMQDPSMKTPSKPTLKSLAPPRLPSRPVVGHKVLPPQLPLQPPSPPLRPLRTIATTRMALATDLSTENGTAELASIFLQDASDLETPDSIELNSGLDFSPQKSHLTGRGPKLIRNGLAAQAASLFSHTSTSLALWAKESSALTKMPRADLRLRVVQIIHRPSPKTPASSPITGLALCRVHSYQVLFDQEPRLKPAAEFPIQNDELDAQSPLVLVHFSFAPHPPSSDPIRNAMYFESNAEFWVWKPWRTLALSVFQIQSLSSLGPSLVVHSTAILCDRFIYRKST
ncbi:hypothetical protein GYMLUDRAFT_624366 [Collybiopsis luxurians FD-317 M1]|nr:hypothetical protein GYMLUDRAFT_624366 [Collybiopsis luxurians FD-317 M1]